MPPKPAPKSQTLVANDASRMKGELKRMGGSDFDDFNNDIINRTIQSQWLAHSDAEERVNKSYAAIGALAGIGPKDEMEAMLAAQMVAAHNAAMECYRRAMILEQTSEGRKDNLNQAAKLSRTHATLVEALNKHRGKGQQKVMVEHVHVHQGGQAIVGAVETKGGGGIGKS